MTWGELKEAVRHLGLVDSFDNRTLENYIFDATVRGLRTLARLLPSERVYRLAHYPSAPVGGPYSFAYEGKTVNYSCGAVGVICFYMIDGNGSLTIKAKDKSATFEISARSGERKLVRYYIHEIFPELAEPLLDISLTFTGNSFYYVEGLTFYGLHGVTDALPYGEHICYDISSLVTDFLRLQTPPVRRGQTPLLLNVDYSLVDSHTVGLPPALTGTFDIHYEHCPNPVTYDTPDSEMLDVEPEIEDLLPLIVAYYIWADDEPEKAGAYYQRYAEQAAIVQSKRRVKPNLNFKSFDGWD